MAEVSPAVSRYRSLRVKLYEIRRMTNDTDSPEEDEILDQMDLAWQEATPEERRNL